MYACPSDEGHSSDSSCESELMHHGDISVGHALSFSWSTSVNGPEEEDKSYKQAAQQPVYLLHKNKSHHCSLGTTGNVWIAHSVLLLWMCILY